MTLTHIAVFISIAILIRLIHRPLVSNWMMFFSSLLFVFWLQPVSTIRSLEFWLPSMLVGLTMLAWVMVSSKEDISKKANRIAGAAAVVVILAISALRYLNFSFLSGLINPPEIWWVVLFILVGSLSGWRVVKSSPENKRPALVAILVLIVIFVFLKYQPMTDQLSRFLRRINGQSLSLASANEITWVGYSYFAFRLIHVLREWQQGRQIRIDLQDFIIYILYFPAFTAGPIDRWDHFQREMENRGSQPVESDFLEGGRRIVKGLFYKFILADSLALIALNATTAQQVNRTVWMWVIVYAYAFRLYFDFSGYSDLAIGIARLMGIQLPENFKRPYLAENVTIFWNRWHITLTQWFRTYYFNPVTRYLRTRKHPIPTSLMVFFTQISTMVLIALWHGISLNFLLWGLWNGVGMFIHNRWSDWCKTRGPAESKNQILGKVGRYVSVFMTFNFIALGWVWFALPDVNSAMQVFSKLLGGS